MVVGLNEEQNGLKLIKVNDGFVVVDLNVRPVKNEHYLFINPKSTRNPVSIHLCESIYNNGNLEPKSNSLSIIEHRIEWSHKILFATPNLNLEGVPEIELKKDIVYVLLADMDGTMRSTDEPFGVAVKTKEAADQYIKKGGVGYSHSYSELRIFNSSKEARDWKFRNIEPVQSQQILFTLDDVKKLFAKSIEVAPQSETHTRMISDFEYRHYVLDTLWADVMLPFAQSLKQPKVEITFENDKPIKCVML